MDDNLSLIEKARSILRQPVKTLGDIDELYMIIIELWDMAWEYWELAATEEFNYNKSMKEWIAQQIKMGVPYNKADAITWAEVEKQYWEYRVHNKRWLRYNNFVSRVEWYIKFWMHKNKIDIMAEDASKRF